MKAVVLAGGNGTRMLEHSINNPKPLINVNNKPFLYYVIKTLEKAGVTQIGIVYSKHKQKFQDFLDEYGLKATLLLQQKPLGTGDALKSAKEFTGEDEFIMLPGDCLFSVNDIKKLFDKNNALLGCHREDTHKFGVIKTNNGSLNEIIEKPKDYGPGLVNTSIYKLNKRIYYFLENLEKSERGEYELTDAVTKLAEEQEIEVVKLDDYWIDFGTPIDIKIVEEFLSK